MPQSIHTENNFKYDRSSSFNTIAWIGTWTTGKLKDNKRIETNVPDVEGETENKEYMTLNKQVTGQYLIIGTTIRFNGWNEGWKYILTLARPASQTNTYLGDE